MSFSVAITGTRGITAKHGGFETFAEELAQFLVARGIDVTVYCQTDERRGQFRDQWNGVSRVGFGGVFSGAIGTVFFDLRTVLDVVRVRPDVVLTLGYNTAALCLLLKMFGIANVINMDGIEWRRAKWSRLAKVWFWLNEWIAAHIGDRLIADHPEIKRHLARHGVSDKTTVIPYGAHTVEETKSDVLEKL